MQRGSPHANNHTWGCRYRDHPDDAQLRQLLFMYREFHSEAVRFLLPNASFWDESGQPSFVGALHLGLRQRFSGKVNHLQSTLGEEPQDNQKRKTFLYLFDSVPGGTGYLRQLMERGGTDLKEVFQQSLDALQACGCSDGCYRCVFMYRQRFDREHTSKQRAIEQLQAILEHWSELTTPECGLSDVTIDTLAESELELRFIEKLREGKGAPSGVTVSMKGDVIQGRNGYLLSLKHRSNRVVRWKVQQQVFLGESEGVSCGSRADFLLTPTAGGKPIAVYTDGWEFHRGRLATDAQQRMALQRSSRYLFWGLTWDDVVEALPSPRSPLEPNGLAQGINSQFDRKPEIFLNRWWAGELQGKALVMPREAQTIGSLELLMAYLAEPCERLWQGMAQQFSLAQAAQHNLDHPEISAAIGSLQLKDHVDEWKSNGTKNARRIGQTLQINRGLSSLVLVDPGLHEHKHPCASFRSTHFAINEECTTEQQQAAWREWLRLGNLFQFLPHGLLTTPGYAGAEQSVAVDPPAVWVVGDATTAPNAVSASPEQQQRQSTWKAIVELAIQECRPLLNALKPLLETGLPLPEDGYELIGARGEVIAEAELAWADSRLAVVADPADVDTFTQQQWACWKVSDPPDVVANAILQHLQHADQNSP